MDTTHHLKEIGQKYLTEYFLLDKCIHVKDEKSAANIRGLARVGQIAME
jgi:hypothetical protein